MRNKCSGAAALIAIAVMVAVVIGLLAAIFVSMNSPNSGGDDAIKAMGKTLALATAQMDALSKLLTASTSASVGSETPPIAIATSTSGPATPQIGTDTSGAPATFPEVTASQATVDTSSQTAPADIQNQTPDAVGPIPGQTGSE